MQKITEIEEYYTVTEKEIVDGKEVLIEKKLKTFSPRTICQRLAQVRSLLIGQCFLFCFFLYHFYRNWIYFANNRQYKC